MGPLSRIVEIRKVDLDESGMRIDRWFKCHYPSLSFSFLQKLFHSGQIRLNGGRVKSSTRICSGQLIRVPPLNVRQKITASLMGNRVSQILLRMLLYKDDGVFVFNKPSGLSVQGGSGLLYNLDRMLAVWPNKKGDKPRLVHRLDRETSGVLVIARTRYAAQKLTDSFRARDVSKKYWALVSGVPMKKGDRISTGLIKEKGIEGHRIHVCEYGLSGSIHAVSSYRTIETVGQRVSWLEMEAYTGRTHQLRVHACHIGHPILGDRKYFLMNEKRLFLAGMQDRLHLHAHRIQIPNPSGGILDMSAPLPKHMVQSFNLLDLDQNRNL
ncbi:MAG: 23S rRNA pseudouridine synthase [Candidatus Tokpelaia sp. JSC161]|jgi:23S rRNA pseudouridine955/2504/2580 synthase|nr:MAG: 23S rRNA pseudouridine synthase [Candidatus Tokpelaia sp. JSC161]